MNELEDFRQWVNEHEIFIEEDFDEYLSDDELDEILFNRERARDVNSYLDNT